MTFENENSTETTDNEEIKTTDLNGKLLEKYETPNGDFNEYSPLQNEKKEDITVTIETKPRILTYRISETPPIYLILFFAFQQAILSLPSCLTTVALVAEFICARDLETLKARMLCTTMMMSGICTFLQVTVGIRLPLFQGPSKGYIIPLIALAALPEFQCPTKSDFDSGVNGTLSNETYDSAIARIAMFRLQSLFGTSVPDEELVSEMCTSDTLKLKPMQGALLAAGLVHMLVGLTGFMGFLMRFIGPITILPTILLVGLSIYTVVVRFCETHWGISVATAGVSLILSLYLGRRKMPIPVWSKEKGFHIIRYPLHQVLSILVSMAFGWGLSAILTAANVLSSDPDGKEYYARSDSRLSVITNTPVILLPYPGQYGENRFSFGIFVGFMSATIVSIIDSIGDYFACARMTRVPSPPVHAVNRGLFIEGFCSALAGLFGCGHATTTYGGNIGAIGITKVASRRVFQMFGITLIIFSIFGKFGAVFITIPYAVIGGTSIISIGIFIGLVMSNMQYIDMASTRNLAIIGISILVGLMVPYWTKNNPDFIDTGTVQVDNLIKILMTTPNVAGGLLACLLDNTVPGTLEERGLLHWSSGGESDESSTFDYEENGHIYEVAKISKWLKKFPCLKYVPVFPHYRPSNISLCRSCKREKKVKE